MPWGNNDVHLIRLIGKRVEDFLLELIEPFFWEPPSEYRLQIGVFAPMESA